MYRDTNVYSPSELGLIETRYKTRRRVTRSNYSHSVEASDDASQLTPSWRRVKKTKGFSLFRFLWVSVFLVYEPRACIVRLCFERKIVQSPKERNRVIFKTLKLYFVLKADYFSKYNSWNETMLKKRREQREDMIIWWFSDIGTAFVTSSFYSKSFPIKSGDLSN